jgi:hypothetical protein
MTRSLSTTCKTCQWNLETLPNSAKGSQLIEKITRYHRHTHRMYRIPGTVNAGHRYLPERYGSSSVRSNGPLLMDARSTRHHANQTSYDGPPLRGQHIFIWTLQLRKRKIKLIENKRLGDGAMCVISDAFMPYMCVVMDGPGRRWVRAETG